MTSILTYVVLLPMVFSTPVRLGAFWWGALDTQYVMPGQWVRYPLFWNDIEAEPGTYTWGYQADTALGYFERNGNPVMINIHRSPAWARDDDYLCSLPVQDAIDDLVRFVLAAIDRYHPEAIELWNETETSGTASATINWCCGCGTPAEYQAALSAVYTAVKAAHPDVLVVGGSLLYVDSAWTKTWLGYNPQMDAVTYHYYRTYGQTLDTFEMIARRDYLQARTSAPVWLGETALLCNPATQDCDTTFRQQQADWLRAVLATDVTKIFWYSQTWVNWGECDLVNQVTDVTYPAWNVFMDALRVMP